MATPVLMPRMGYDMTEGKIVKWLKQVNDPVEKGDALAEIETEKVNIDIEAFQSGILTEILAQPGQMVPVGEPIAMIGKAGEKGAEKATAAPAAPAMPTPAPAAPPSEAPKVAPSLEKEARIKASPLARRMAEEHGIDLAGLQGSGPGGRIQRKDVEQALQKGVPQAPETKERLPQKPSVPREAAPPPGKVEAKKPVVSPRMREAIAHVMSDSKRNIPHFYITVAVEMDEALAMLTKVNEVASQKITINDLLIKALALALPRHPELNARYENGQVRTFEQVHLGIAVAVEGGLLLPVLQNAQALSLVESAKESRRLSQAARSGHLRQEDYGDATFTISNLGAFDVEEFLAIIVPPQSAILAVGTAKPNPVVREGKVEIATLMRLSLSCDHRVTDGAQAARFLAELKRILQEPYSLVI